LSNNVNRTIANQLFGSVFRYYLVIAVIVFGGFFVKEYFQSRQQAIHNLNLHEREYAVPLAEILWQFDTDALGQLGKRIVENEDICSVRFLDHNGVEIIPKAGEATKLPIVTEHLTYEFPVYYRHDEGEELVGKVVLYASVDLVFERILDRMLVLGLSLLLMTAALWFSLQRAGQSILSKPLSRLTELTSNLEFSKLEDFQDFSTKRHKNELDVLESSFSKMISGLMESKAEVAYSQAELENRVEERTSELKNEISERKKIETVLRQSKDSLAEAQRIAQMGSWTWELENNEVISSEETVRIFDYAGEIDQPTFADYFERIHPDDRAHVETDINKALEGVPYLTQLRVILKNGHIRYIESQGEVAFDTSGEPVLFRGTAKDITRRKMAEEDRNREIEFRRQLLETTLEGYWEISPDGITVEVNPAMCRILDRPRQDIIGKSTFEFVDAKNAEILKAEQIARKQGLIGYYEAELQRPDGTNIPCINNATPILDENGKLTGTVGMWTDISERKLAEADLKKSMNEAEAANKAKSEFLASMSHEIRTPLAGVAGFADMLLEDEIPEESKNKVHRIKGSIDSLTRIINDILDMSKMDAGKMEIENIDFHLPSLIEDVFVLFERTRKSDHEVKLELDLADDFPTGVRADPTRIRQVLVNLIGNARKFTREGKVTVDGKRSQSDDGSEMFRISITDTGIGIKEEMIPDLFSEFTQADASITRKFEGTGLGLVISKRLVELMGGEIGVDSVFGKGSTFWFMLPFVPAATEVAESPAKSVVASFETQRPLNILIAEDNRINQRILMATMEAYGHGVDIVENGLQAIEAHEQGGFDLILMDVRMPEMSGPDATRAIRQMSDEKSGIPIIAVTADAMTEHQKGYYEAGMNGVVTKPIDRSELLETINEVMDEDIHVAVEVEIEEPESAIEEASAEPDADVEDFLRQLQDVADQHEE